MDEKIKTWTLRFPAKENPNKQKELFDWPIVLQYDVKAKYRLISRKFSGMKFFHPSVRLTKQKPREFVSSSINQSNHSVSFRLLFFSRVFISRSYENCSIIVLTLSSFRLTVSFCPHPNSFLCPLFGFSVSKGESLFASLRSLWVETAEILASIAKGLPCFK